MGHRLNTNTCEIGVFQTFQESAHNSSCDHIIAEKQLEAYIVQSLLLQTRKVQISYWKTTRLCDPQSRNL
jgi:hypothetical protein